MGTVCGDTEKQRKKSRETLYKAVGTVVTLMTTTEMITLNMHTSKHV